MNARLEIIDATPKAFRVRFPTGHDCWLPKAAAEYLAGLVAEIDAWNRLVLEHHACGAMDDMRAGVACPVCLDRCPPALRCAMGLSPVKP